MNINASALLTFLEPVFKFQSKKSLNPLSECVILEANSSGLTATVNGVSAGIRSRMEMEITTPFQVAVPIGILSETLRHLNDNEITAEQKGERLELFTANGVYVINCEDIKQTPEFPTFNQSSAPVDGLELKRALEAVLFCASKGQLPTRLKIEGLVKRICKPG